jgi:membrane dipeptidase
MQKIIDNARRQWLKAAGAAGLLGATGCATTEPAGGDTPVFMDGHTHVTNRIYWEKMDPWAPQTGPGWDYARAKAAGINCVIDNIGTYGYWNYNYTPKQALRLIETFLQYAEKHADKMGVALSVADARRIIASGRMAVFLGCESGFDHEGDLDVLRSMYRLGMRTIQFATQTGWNAFSDSALAPVQGGQKPEHYRGINERGRALVREMNRLGVLIDITHGTEAVHLQLIEASRAPVVASHDTFAAVAGAGLSEGVLKALSAKGGLVGIHGGAGVISRRYQQWLQGNPERLKNATSVVLGMVGHVPSVGRAAGDHGEYIAKMDDEFRERWAALGRWRELPDAPLPTAEEWTAQVDYVIRTVGADHVAIGLDMVNGRSAYPNDSGGYGELMAALKRVTTPANVRKITGENWFRVLDQARA